ncbi:hypothetical protein PGTUg99_025286 [Puccinia graminis f. sp. tritici]|uniref:Uncharacterized protein n=1 Tax=Puccinia graminis f. sp. tritici TaxID=56615 RepID=A0A5B0QLD4_PUCGR|nr:hypothetical protein PGTUg99_025286 [Puccinia graminis f. sp. tritici]
MIYYTPGAVRCPGDGTFVSVENVRLGTDVAPVPQPVPHRDGNVDCPAARPLPEKQTQIDLLTPHYGLRRQPVTGNQPASGRLGLNKLLNWCRQLHAHRALTGQFTSNLDFSAPAVYNQSFLGSRLWATRQTPQCSKWVWNSTQSERLSHSCCYIFVSNGGDGQAGRHTFEVVQLCAHVDRLILFPFHLCSLPSHSPPSQSPQLDSRSPATCLSKSPLRQKPNIAAAIVTLSCNALPRPLYVCDDPSNTPKFSGYCTGVTSRATSQDPSAAAPDTLVMTRATRQES